MRTRTAVLVGLAGLMLSAPAQAGHHLWKVSEAFSNASGSVQFVELFCTANSEAGLGAFTLTSTTNTLNFVTNLPSATTLNTWALCATSNFASQAGGITPDYIIPANFFPTGGGTLNYASGIDAWAYGAVPTDGVNSLNKSTSNIVTTGVNSPHNFAGASGSVNLASTVSATSTWGIVLTLGALLLVASGLLRKREPSRA